MRDLVVTQNITIDGVVEASGWFEPAGDDTGGDRSDVEEALREQSAAADALLLGRVTFEDMRGYWPQRTDDRSGVADYLDSVQKYVVSRSVRDPRWQRTTVLDDGWEDDVRELKSGSGKDIVSTGSISIVHRLGAAGLVDEYRLFVHPVVVRSGRRLFDQDGVPVNLNLVEARPFRSGVVLLRYRTG